MVASLPERFQSLKRDIPLCNQRAGARTQTREHGFNRSSATSLYATDTAAIQAAINSLKFQSLKRDIPLCNEAYRERAEREARSVSIAQARHPFMQPNAAGTLSAGNTMFQSLKRDIPLCNLRQSVRANSPSKNCFNRSSATSLYATSPT